MFEEVFAKLEKSAFRRKFKLTDADKQYIETKGYDVIRRHAEDFVKKRLSPPASQLKNDGKQTPMRGHPVLRLSTPALVAAGNAFINGTAFILTIG